MLGSCIVQQALQVIPEQQQVGAAAGYFMPFGCMPKNVKGILAVLGRSLFEDLDPVGYGSAGCLVYKRMAPVDHKVAHVHHIGLFKVVDSVAIGMARSEVVALDLF